MLSISPSAAAAIAAHAAAAYPEECCGMLLAQPAAPPGAPDLPARRDPIHIVDVIPAQNLAHANRSSRFILDPRAYIHADREATARGLTLVGCYHTHPDHPAIPSATDVSLAWPDFLYLILRITAHGPAELRAWRYEQAEPRELPIM